MNGVLVDGARIAYRLDGPGDAPSLVLINSLGTDMRMWEPQIASLSRVYRVLRYDCRGHGGSTMPDEPLTLDRLGQDVVALLDHLQIARAHICGLSLGGITALWVAARHPQRVDRAVFADTAARIGTAETWAARIAAVQAGGMAAVRDMVLARLFSDVFHARQPEVAERFGAMLESIDPAGYIAACSALRDADLRAEVASIRVPALIVVGALDVATPPAQSEELHAAIAGSRLVILPSVGHLANVEQPERFTASVLAFLGASTQ
jgi:3-oxoadipate enol-lactonase